MLTEECGCCESRQHMREPPLQKRFAAADPACLLCSRRGTPTACLGYQSGGHRPFRARRSRRSRKARRAQRLRGPHLHAPANKRTENLDCQKRLSEGTMYDTNPLETKRIFLTQQLSQTFSKQEGRKLPGWLCCWASVPISAAVCRTATNR